MRLGSSYSTITKPSQTATYPAGLESKYTIAVLVSNRLVTNFIKAKLHVKTNASRVVEVRLKFMTLFYELKESHATVGEEELVRGVGRGA